MVKNELGRNMEAYVDDMLVKGKIAELHAKDLEETLATVRKYEMRLNTAKCSFGVRAGKFLGYMVTKRGIEVKVTTPNIEGSLDTDYVSCGSQ